jgi:Cof subfamily protein (haloacid dehalogenase superfamily)
VPVQPAAAVGLVALDVDGTVLTPEGGIAPSTVAAVAAARDGGVRAVLASSRGPVALLRIQDGLGLRDEWFIGYQGALVARWTGRQLEVLSETTLDRAAARDVETRALAAGLSVGRYIGLRWRVPQLTDSVRHEASLTGEEPIVSTPEESDADAAPHKLMVMAAGDAQIAALAQLAGTLPRSVTATLSHPANLEITAAGVDKASGIAPLAARLGIPAEETAAIGDGPNDLGLFAAVAHPVAMGQATAEVQAAARWVTSSNTRDGVARALTHLGLVREDAWSSLAGQRSISFTSAKR